jgi:hypothetical protein
VIEGAMNVITIVYFFVKTIKWVYGYEALKMMRAPTAARSGVTRELSGLLGPV